METSTPKKVPTLRVDLAKFQEIALSLSPEAATRVVLQIPEIFGRSLIFSDGEATPGEAVAETKHPGKGVAAGAPSGVERAQPKGGTRGADSSPRRTAASERLDEVDRRVLEAVAAGAASRSEIMERVGLTTNRFRGAMERLKASRQLFAAGPGRRATFYGCTQSEADNRYAAWRALHAAAPSEPAPVEHPSKSKPRSKRPVGAKKRTRR